MELMVLNKNASMKHCFSIYLQTSADVGVNSSILVPIALLISHLKIQCVLTPGMSIMSVFKEAEMVLSDAVVGRFNITTCARTSTKSFEISPEW